MTHKKFTSKSWRTRKVYWVVLVIHLDYLLLFIGTKIFGKRFFDKRFAKLNVKSAERLKRTFLELQGLFIKIGQLVSILSSFLPEEFRKPLEDFQDKAPVRPYQEIAQRIEKELGGTPDKVFASFEVEPIASASIGQVHRARLPDGTTVVVKIQHAHIPEIADIDLRLFENVMRWVSRIFKVKGVEHVASQIKQMIEEELDYKLEAENMERIRENLKILDFVFIPNTYPEYCTPHIITSTFVKGTKINNFRQLAAWEIEREKLARQFLQMCCHMALANDLYHADPHPGNLIITQNGQIALLDFGAVSTLPKRAKQGLAQLIEAAVKGDTEEIISAMQFMGFVSKGKDSTRFAERMLSLVQEFFQKEIQMESLNFKDIQVDIDAIPMGQLLEIFSFQEMANSFQIPKDYILLNRMILLATGISTELAPKLNPLEEVRPYLYKYVLEDGKSLPQFLLDFVRKNLTNLLTLPLEVRKVLEKTRRGELEVQIRGMEEKVGIFYFVGQQVSYTFLLIAVGMLAYHAHQDGLVEVVNWSIGGGILLMLLWLRAAFKAKRLLNFFR